MSQDRKRAFHMIDNIYYVGTERNLMDVHGAS